MKFSFVHWARNLISVSIFLQVFAMDLTTISNNSVKHVSTGEIVTLGSLWKDNKTVIIFFRRWGCIFCRVMAREVSTLAPILNKHGIKLVGVGPEDLGVEEFVQGKFFDGELYVDVDKKTYTSLEFKRFNYVTVLASLLWKDSRTAYQKAKDMNITGDLKGDGLQTGGSLVIDENGKVLLLFKQDGPAATLPIEKYLEALNLQSEIPNLKPVDCKPIECAEECKVGDNKN